MLEAAYKRNMCEGQNISGHAVLQILSVHKPIHYGKTLRKPDKTPLGIWCTASTDTATLENVDLRMCLKIWSSSYGDLHEMFKLQSLETHQQ